MGGASVRPLGRVAEEGADDCGVAVNVDGDAEEVVGRAPQWRRMLELLLEGPRRATADEHEC